MEQQTTAKPQDDKSWAQNEYAKVLKYCAEKGLQIKRVEQKNCRILPPLVGLWWVKLADKELPDLWVITGDLPTDHLSVKVADNARDAMRHFSMSWQMKASQLEEGLAAGKPTLGDAKTQQDYIGYLISRAEGLYELHGKDEFWQNEA